MDKIVNRVDKGRLAATLLVIGLTILYLWDARDTSLDVQNLILVQSAAVFILVFSIPVLIGCFRLRAEANNLVDERAKVSWRLPILMLAFGAFVLAFEKVGMDVATLIFVATATWICGERKIIPLLTFSFAFTGFIAWGFSSIIPYEIPMFLF